MPWEASPYYLPHFLPFLELLGPVRVYLFANGVLTNVSTGLAGVTITSAMGFTTAVCFFEYTQLRFLTQCYRFTGPAGDVKTLATSEELCLKAL